MICLMFLWDFWIFYFCAKYPLFSSLNWCLDTKRGRVPEKIKISCAVVAFPWTIHIYFVSILFIKHDEKINIHNNKMWKFWYFFVCTLCIKFIKLHIDSLMVWMDNK